MKPITFFLSVALTAVYAYEVSIAHMGPFKNLRYEDDFAYLKSDSAHKTGTDHLKYIMFSRANDAHISFGGELRAWYNFRKNVNWGDLPPGFVEDDNGAVLSRTMAHADFWYGRRFRTFGQLNGTYIIGSPNDPIPEIDRDGIDLHQAFVEAHVGPDAQPDRFMLRLGRQEFNFGNELLISSREGPNNRQPFDAVSAIYRNNGATMHLFAGTPIIINTGNFDNERIEEYVWGAYTTFKPTALPYMDAYYIGFNTERRAFNYVPGEQTRHTLGTRAWNRTTDYAYEVEGMYQFGVFNDLTINAYNLSGQIKYYFTGAGKPMIGLEASYISGDKSSTDGRLNTFDPLYPKPTFGLGAPLGPANMISLRPMAGVAFDNQLFINGSVYFLARQSNRDGTYTPSMVQLRPLPLAASDATYIGTQYALDIFFRPHPSWTFISFSAYIPPGAYVRETGAGKDIYYFSLSAAYKF